MQKDASALKLLMLLVLFMLLGSCSANGSKENATKSDNESVKFKVDTRLFPYKAHYLTLNNGAIIHYIDEGNQGESGTQPTLLLLHGNPTWSFLYRKIINELKDDFRLIAPDYPGFGLSSAPRGYTFTAAEQAQAISEFV